MTSQQHSLLCQPNKCWLTYQIYTLKKGNEKDGEKEREENALEILGKRKNLFTFASSFPCVLVAYFRAISYIYVLRSVKYTPTQLLLVTAMVRHLSQVENLVFMSSSKSTVVRVKGPLQ